MKNFDCVKTLETIAVMCADNGQLTTTMHDIIEYHAMMIGNKCGIDIIDVLNDDAGDESKLNTIIGIIDMELENIHNQKMMENAENIKSLINGAFSNAPKYLVHPTYPAHNNKPGLLLCDISMLTHDIVMHDVYVMHDNACGQILSIINDNMTVSAGNVIVNDVNTIFSLLYKIFMICDRLICDIKRA